MTGFPHFREAEIQGVVDPRHVFACAKSYQKSLHEKANDGADTHVLGCNEIDIGFATYGAIDVSLVFDHGKSVADT